MTLEDVVIDISSGDWGQEQAGQGLDPARVIRATDFAKAERKSLDGVPIRYLKTSSLAIRRLRSTDLLVEISGGSEDRPTGRVLLIAGDMLVDPFPVAFSNFVKRMRVDTSKVHPSFFAYFWGYLYAQGHTRTYEKRTTGIRNFKLADFLANERIPVVPLHEQGASASVLDAMRRAQTASEKLVMSMRELRRSLVRHLFTYGAVAMADAERVALKRTDAGLMPESWESAALGDIATLQRGHDLPVAERSVGPYPVIGSNGVVGSHSEFKATGPGVLVGRSGSVGKVFWIDSDYWPLNTSLWVKDFHGNDARYVYYLLGYLDLQRYAAGVSVPTLNRNLIHPIRLAVPDYEEQKAIATVLSAVDRRIDAELRRLSALRTLFDTAVAELMDGRRSVGVGIN